MTKEIISSHIFVFPFRWDVVKDEACFDTCIDSRLNTEKFIKYLKDNNQWEEDINISNIVENKEVENDLDYNTYAYFYDNVRKAIYGNPNSIKKNKNISVDLKNSKYYAGKLFNKKISNTIVRCLNYKNIDANSIYEIHVEKKDDKGTIVFDEHYKLKIKSIKLKVYDTGVATLSYFLNNYEWKNKEDILRINDYGRRIYPQHIPLDTVRSNFLAKKLSLKLKKRIIEEEFDYEIKEKPTKISKTIINILGEKFVSTEKELRYKSLSKEEIIFVKPVIDDRMFVICYYNNGFHSRVLTKYDKDEYLKNDFWYQFLFVDNDGATCKDEEMTKELLLKSTYTRWKSYGTLFGISRYSFVILCDESGFSKDVLYNHINIIYYEMILLALVQRASILRFSDETSRIASFERKNIYEQIKKLQEYYIRFVNTIYFREVTAQEQGIELYDKIVELMRIDTEVKRLDEEIDEIQRYINLETNDRTNRLLNVITFVGIGISVISLISSLFSNSKQIGDLTWLVTWQYVPFVMVLLVISVIKNYVNDNKVIKIIMWVITLLAIYIVLDYKFIKLFIK
ncbi:hypothetical protein FDG46_11400 [Clostridium botulinum]|uniref:Membrane protein n=1 Tax=Clostridium botulinum (strain Hall / ATCC 3502 / NCTC 13319 / Type A) TaxID=441771 RepID=A5I3U8_CLOBH|nr:hypothetical protein [Clostridium botulinum]ABS34408.1 hypothetical protein CLB_2115 [Clostridium botulinum A str. ATCC 19397]ABS35980.1 hypothetical protein CLC_2119 [Clostridium botulinum A str. Hall]AWB18040.1 hypothetical protein DB732_11315 [Clostridium botulinum]EGT5614311.1 hypothetical protein [Clostridium botulinum]EGT5622364.1 hypothetical protein [Clostridium botulinum]